MKYSTILKALFATKEKLTSSKRIVLFVITTLITPHLAASIGYTAVRTTGVSYSAITGASSFASWKNGNNTDDNLSGSTAIGFNFYYDGAMRTTFSASTNGFITFNSSTTAIGSGTGAYGYNNTTFSSSTTQSVAPFYYDLQTAGNPSTASSLASSVKYKLTGTSPNRILTVEWKSMEVFGISGPNLNFQIKLYETSNKIEYLYGTMTASTASYSYTSGLNSSVLSTPPVAGELFCQQTDNTAVFSNTVSNSLLVIPASSTKLAFTPWSNCSGTPVAGTATAATPAFCTSGSTSITLSGYTTGVFGIGFQWQNSTDGGTTWTNITGATGTVYTTPILTATTQFRCAVSCSSSGSLAYSSVSTVTINTPPVLTCPANITASAVSACSAVVTYSATATGTPAPVISYSIGSGSVFNAGTTTVAVTATNSCGTSTCSFTVTVVAGGTNYWLGASDNNWFNSANWCSGIPTATSDVQIPSGVVNMPLINASGAVCKNITINSGATLQLSSAGSLAVKGNWTNSGTFSSTTGSVQFSGTSPQVLSGTNSFYDFELNNNNGLTFATGGQIKITHLGAFTNGIITTGTGLVSVDSSGSINAINGYVNGYLKKTVNAGINISQTFEVGSATAYAPVNFYFNSVSSSGTLTVNTLAADHSSIATSGLNASKTINRHWNFANSGIVFDFYNLNVNCVTADRDPGFTDLYSGAKMFTLGTWVPYPTHHYTSNTFTFVDLLSFGSLQIGVFNPVPSAFSVNPSYAYKGQTLNLTINGRGFVSSTSALSSMSGITVNSLSVNNDSTITANVSISTSAAGGIRKFAVKNPPPFGGVSDSLDFEVRNLPVANFYANRVKIVCNISGNVEFNDYSTDAAGYLWDFGTGAVPATSTTGGAQIVSYSTTGYKTVKLIVFSPVGNDTLIRTNYVNVTAAAPAAATGITGLTNICGITSPTVVYNTPLVTDVVYDWTVPSTATIVSGQGTRTLFVSFSSAYTTGNITVKLTNACGSSTVKSLAVSKAPAAPASISGPSITCGLTSATYTAATSAGAVSYTWTLPAGITTSAGPSPVTTTGPSLSVNISTTFSSGTLSVKANSACSSSSAKSLLLHTATLAPGAVSGATNVCSMLTETYSFTAVAGATSYTWTLPTGITSSTGASVVTTTSSNLTVNILPTFSTGSIGIKANNACAASAARTVALSGCHSSTESIAEDTIPSRDPKVLVYPNPSSGAFSVVFSSARSSQLNYSIVDIKGGKVGGGILAVTEGENSFSFLENELEKGLYFLELNDESNAIHEVMKLVIQ